MNIEASQTADLEIEKDSWPLWCWKWFWRLTFVASIPLVWYCFYVPSNEIRWASDFASAKEFATEADKPMLLYFTGEWCVPCRIMKRQVLADSEVSSAVNSKFVPLMIDLDDPSAAEEISRYNVLGPPITILTHSNGDPITFRAGGMTKPEFYEFLEEVEAGQSE